MLVLILVWLPNGSEPKGNTGLLSCKKCGNHWKEPREGVWAISHKWIAQLKSEREHWREFVEMDELKEMCRGMQESTWPTVRNIRSFRHTLSWSHGRLLTLALLHPRHTRQGVAASLNQEVLIFQKQNMLLSYLHSNLSCVFFASVRLEMLI